MGDGVSVDNPINNRMGATGNPNAARLATLQERKKTIEENLVKCNQELRQLCMEEADLTGTIPVEMPLEPGESLPSIRRRVGTSFQLPENLINKNANNNKDESVTDLELQSQLHANLAEAALGLANEHNISKTLRRQHMNEYQQHKQKYTGLQEKLALVKKQQQQQQQQQQINELHKQKKKPRPIEQDDNISMATSITNEPFGSSDQRHSIRSNKTVSSKSKISPDQYVMNTTTATRMSYENCYPEHSGYIRYQQSDDLARNFYRLSINGFKNYIERRESVTNGHLQPSPLSHSYPHQPQSKSLINQHPQLSPHYPQYVQSSCNSTMYPSPPQQLPPQHHQQKYYYIPNSPTQIHSIPQHPQQSSYRMQQQQRRQSSPDINPANTQPQRILYHQPSLDLNQQHLMYPRKYHKERESYPNPHQIQPHQQYEHMSTGLGGYWKPSETGDMVWCNSNTDSWQRDKRFGSLDRRKNKRLHKRISPSSVDNKSATLATVSQYTEEYRIAAAVKSPRVLSRRSQDNRQLVRTQSLGSVGALTVDSAWPGDDNSSCDSDTHSITDLQNARKQKQKQWMETSLDGPVSPTHSVISRSQSAALPSVLSPDDKYVSATTPPPSSPAPIAIPKPPLEIPAESNPSPKMPENIEIFNNNIPKNCTIVQAGHCKPYHEETKPFEMSDFYKYSTKYKKSPQKMPPQDDGSKKPPVPPPPPLKNLSEAFEKVRNNNISPLSPGRLDNAASSLNSSLDLSGNVAERFSDEMNAWYKNHKLQIDNTAGSVGSKGKSTATLV